MMAPKRKSESQGASLREAAAALGMTRAALLKMIDKGLPSTLVRERRMVNIDAARAWLTEHEATAVVDARTVLPLSPDDPRAKRDRASARLKAYKLAEDQGLMIPVVDIAARHGRALTDFNSALKSVPAMIANDIPTMVRGNAVARIAPAIEDALRMVDSDDEECTNAWPQPSPIVIDFPSDDSEDEFESHAPLLSPRDDRAVLANTQAAKYGAEADALARSLITYEDAVRILAEKCEAVRARFRKVPALVAARLAPDHNAPPFVIACIVYEVDRARLDCGGSIDGELVPPVPDVAADEVPLESVDGLREFEEPETESDFEDA